MNINNIFAMFLSFLVGGVLVFTLWRPLFDWGEAMYTTYPELAVVFTVGLVGFAVYFFFMNPLAVGHTDEK